MYCKDGGRNEKRGIYTQRDENSSIYIVFIWYIHIYIYTLILNSCKSDDGQVRPKHVACLTKH